MNVTAGDEATFTCRAGIPAIDVYFLINGRSVNMLSDDSRISKSLQSGVHTLSIRADVEFNNTIVECNLVTTDLQLLSTDEVLLGVQGMYACIVVNVTLL